MEQMIDQAGLSDWAAKWADNPSHGPAVAKWADNTSTGPAVSGSCYDYLIYFYNSFF